MTTEPIKLFYSYAHEDEKLRKRLEISLKTLQRQGLIAGWSDREIRAGGLWAQEIDEHLKTAHIILLLISPDFIASDYCYGVEMTLALERHERGEARVIPVILRPTDLKKTPFMKLQVLPKDAKPVTTWTRQDEAFLDIARGIRRVVEEMSGTISSTTPPAAAGRKRGRAAQQPMPSSKQSASATATANGTPTLNAATLKRAIARYYQELKGYQGVAKHELALRTAFQNMLAALANNLGWKLVPEQTLEDGLRPDGVLRDAIGLRRGYWEAKGPGSNLEREIEEKIRKGYPLTNTVFENTKTAVLYQGKRRVLTCDLQRSDELQHLLRSFLTYTEPHIEKFQKAVLEFKESLPGLARDLMEIIQKEHSSNPTFRTAFAGFAALCRSSLDPNLSNAAIDEMLAQHLLTERIFRTVFNNPDFVSRNVIAAEIEKVIQALTSRSFNRQVFLEALDTYYQAIEETARGIRSWTEQQEFLNTVYESFFQGFSVKQADVHGIVYTPPEIVDFMCKSVDVVLQREFGKRLTTPGVKLLDPCVGTGSFIVNLMRPMPPDQLEAKYHRDLFCNEITLLPYYIAALTIEHEYYVKTHHYAPFEGICFVDTLTLEGAQKELPMFSQKNTERVIREREADIMVVIGNPPYNVGQKNENDNNKNRKYPAVDAHIRETYVKDSKATLKTQLYDAYVRFFRWATDRLGGHDGIICFVSNNSFVDQIAFDGMRQNLLRDFNLIFHLDLHGNVRKNPKLSGTTHNVFGIQIGVGITVAVRNLQNPERKLYYYRVPEDWRKEEKLAFLQEKGSIDGIHWQELQPDERNTWITEGLRSEFANFLPVGIRDAKSSHSMIDFALFRKYSGGVKTNRDDWVYDFDEHALAEKMQKFIDTYNGNVDRWQRRVNKSISVDEFVTYDDRLIKWSGDLKAALVKGRDTQYSEQCIRNSLYRPFVKKHLYFDSLLNNSIYLQHLFFPTPATEAENVVICVPGIGNRQGFGCLATNLILNLDLAFEKVQCFPYYVYNEDGSNRRENITDWALRQFQERYGPEVTKWDIFHYVYAMLHHPQYRQRYAENLKRDLPHVPLVRERTAFEACTRIGAALMQKHLNYEKAELFGELAWSREEMDGDPWRVEKMRLTPDRSTVIINSRLALPGIPPECFAYRLGNRSALEWIIDQYQVSTDKRSGIVSDPNRPDDKPYIARLVQRIVTVSVETVCLVAELERVVGVEDWVPTGMP